VVEVLTWFGIGEHKSKEKAFCLGKSELQPQGLYLKQEA
jgi:hypothetical protein